MRLFFHQRFSSSPYRRAQSRRVIVQGARWAGLTAPGCALCGRKSPPRCALGCGMAQARPQGAPPRCAPKARLELHWVHPGIAQAHPGKRRRALVVPGPTPAWHRRAPKVHLELRWVRPGITQAHPGERRRALAVGCVRAHTGMGAQAHPQGAHLALRGAPWDSAGASQDAKARLGCARAHTGMAQARPQGAPQRRTWSPAGCALG